MLFPFIRCLVLLIFVCRRGYSYSPVDRKGRGGPARGGARPKFRSTIRPDHRVLLPSYLPSAARGSNLQTIYTTYSYSYRQIWPFHCLASLGTIKYVVDCYANKYVSILLVSSGRESVSDTSRSPRNGEICLGHHGT